MDVHFLKSGGHIGAFGAMMNSVQKFTIDRASTDGENSNNNNSCDDEGKK